MKKILLLILSIFLITGCSCIEEGTPGAVFNDCYYDCIEEKYLYGTTPFTEAFHHCQGICNKIYSSSTTPSTKVYYIE